MAIPITVISAKNQVVADELQRLHDEAGALHAADVITAAEPEGAPLHAFFTWDDTEAARAYRLNQAAGIIRSCKISVVHTDRAGTTTSHGVRAYVAARHVGDGSEPAGTYYQSAGLTPLQKQLKLQQMNRELNSLRRRYGDMQEFWNSINEIQEKNSEAS